MTQEDKHLLLEDLCARLPYGVKCISGVDDATLIIEGINPNCCGSAEVQVTYERSGINFDTTISAIKPYLFPLSSMTEEQKNNCPICETNLNIIKSNIGYGIIEIPWRLSYLFIDWCNKNHFDYRGLIPMGLALGATGLNIY